MRSGWRRIGRDLKNRRHVDAYSVAFATFVLSVLSLVPDLIPDPVRWAVLLAGVGLLVLRVTIPDPSAGNVDGLLHDRRAFSRNPIAERLKNATEVWIFAPTAVNFLSQHSEMLRTSVLSKPGGAVRVVVLNPANESAIQLATRQLDASVDFPTQDVRATLQTTTHLLRSMSSWPVRGAFDYRFLDYSPGFSLVAIDPGRRDGSVIVEFHGFHNEATPSRMHIEITRKQSDHWYAYWIEQFSRIWEDAAACPPVDPLDGTRSLTADRAD